MSIHENLKGDVLKALDRLFSDKNVGAETTLGDLEEIASEIDIRIEALEAQINESQKYE